MESFSLEKQVINKMRIKIDNRIRTLVENGIITRHRSMFIIIGDKARDQVVTLHHILTKAGISGARPSVLWCYKKELDISSHRKKRIKEIKKKKQAGLIQTKEENLFEQFILATHIRYCYYAESHRILGNTFGMAVLQDFEALTPNLLARTIETVEGGGLIVLLLQSVHSLRQLYTMTMDVHKRYRTEAHSDVVGRFNERFILSLATCPTCVLMDDCLNVLPISSAISKIAPIPANQKGAKSEAQLELQKLQRSLADTKPIGPLLNKCATLCQAKVLLRLLDAATEKATMQNTTCSITAARGRGKSAAMGLAVAGAIGFGFTNIVVTSPSVENLRTLFEFVVKGFEAIGYQEHADYELVTSMDPALDKCVMRVNVFRKHRQTIQYIEPTDAVKLLQAELVVVDEAAAIPFPIVKKLITGPFLVFLASTISGYEGTGRSLSLKLLEQLRQQQSSSTGEEGKKVGIQQRRTLYELTLEESIRYGDNDPVEDWLNRVLCLNPVNLNGTISGTPAPEKCQLYYVNRDALFSFHKAAEIFLSNLMSIYVAAHYKNSPDDLQLLSDAPAHQIFVLMPPVSKEDKSIPQILAVLQICFEGSISYQTITKTQTKGKTAAGDVIPWTICQQFLDSDFPQLCGARIVRIAVHPDFQGMGYGSRAIQLVQQYYQGKFSTFEPTNSHENDEERADESMEVIDEDCQLLQEEITPRANLPPLLQRLAERPAERLDYIGACFGLTLPLLKFWKRLGFLPVHLRQSANSLTGEHSCILLCTVPNSTDEKQANQSVQPTVKSDGTWLCAFFNEFRKRFIPLLGLSFNGFSPHLAFSLLFQSHQAIIDSEKVLSRVELRWVLSDLDLRRLAHYTKNLADQQLITDLLPALGSLYFQGRLGPDAQLELGQAAVLLGVGLQRKSVEEIARQLELPSNQCHALLNKAVRRLSEHFDALCRDALQKKTFAENNGNTAGEEPPAPALKKMRLTHFEQ